MRKSVFTDAAYLFGFMLRLRRKAIMGWCLSLFCLMLLYMILFPVVQDMAQLKLEAMPRELLQFMGMESFSDMSNFVSYFGIIFQLLLIAVSIFAVTFGAGLICKEEKSGTIELLYSMRVGRLTIYSAKLLAGIAAVLSVLASLVVAALICGWLAGGDSFSTVKVIRIAAVGGITPLFFLSAGFLFSGISAKGGAPAIGGMLVLLLYVAGYLGELLGERAPWLIYVSPFAALGSEKALHLTGAVEWSIGAYSVLALIFCLMGGFYYKKRDFAL